jgi:tocopherol cyclase
MGLLTSLLHPEGFHGHGKTSRFFEGWYVKLVSADRAQRWAVIPGVFLGQKGGGEAFVQVLDGATKRSWYQRYPLEQFEARAETFEARVGPNRFSRTGVSLELSEGPLRGSLTFSALNPWPVTLTSPGIMGWYAWVPFMECYHGVVSFHHTLAGTLEIEGKPVSFDGGVGYLEKDWGRAFPAGYVWMQTNHFQTPETSLVASAAIIPWLGTSFPGFIAGFWQRGVLHRFATYSGARIERLDVDDTHVHMAFADARLRLEVSSERRGGGLLHAPIRTEMHKRVEESLDAEVHVKLSEVGGRTLFEEVGRVAGLEVHGELDRLTRMAK